MAFSNEEVDVSYKRCPPGMIPPTSHPHTKVILTIDPASGILRTQAASGDWREHKLNGRHVIAIASGVIHEIQWDREAELIAIDLSPPFFARLPATNVSTLLLREAITEARDDLVIWKLAEAICVACSEVGADASFITENAVLIVKRVFRSSTKSETISKNPGLSSEQRQRFAAYIHANMAETIRLPQLSRAMALSISHLSVLCRKTYGRSPMKHVLEVRLLKAREIALTRRLSVEQIADICGFYDGSHLRGCFKRRFRQPIGNLLR